ncbi:MAG: phenylacetate--CoA ligase family protein [Thermincola sp.]|jgi:phenylacetate-CoA ligase|nr:phenylacetate--CoA ligase family protein [Thermincola sp.]MDT3703241.1 phenylacetate--CoA ligase family protein [Thermincola sp.]
MDINGSIIRNIIFPLMEKRKGNQIRRNLLYLQEKQNLPKEELAVFQKMKLKVLLNHCINSVPAYSTYKYLIDEINQDPTTALGKFPILTKRHFMEHSETFLDSKVDKNSLIPNSTGGSTGEPVRFFMDRNQVEFYEAARWRGLSWWGIDIGDSSTMIWGSPIELGKQQEIIYRLKERFLKNRILISAYDLNFNSVNQYVAMMNRFKPMYLYGYASSLFLFAEMMLKNNLSLKYKPKAVVSTAETLHEFQREIIEKAFLTRTINEYGARDGGIIAYQCQNGKMHLTAENVFVEVVDFDTKQPVNPGESGLLLVTDLNNFSMPRLRYQLGDVAALSTDTCSCGLNLPILSKIDGREDDIFVAISGNYVHGHFFNQITRKLKGIRQFQIIQHSRNKMTLKIIKGEDFDDSQAEQFKEEIYKKMGKIEINIEYVDKIPTSASGKFRYTKREFPLAEGI